MLTSTLFFQSGVSRCFPFWQELLACYAVNVSGDASESGKKKCLPVLEDYYECLHHKKEVRIRVPHSFVSNLHRLTV